MALGAYYTTLRDFFRYSRLNETCMELEWEDFCDLLQSLSRICVEYTRKGLERQSGGLSVSSTGDILKVVLGGNGK